jgi:hypothetical protein
MCMFCAAIPASIAVSAAATGRQKTRDSQAQQPQVPAPKRLPVGKASIALTGGLIVCSLVYHLVIMPHTGAVI